MSSRLHRLLALFAMTLLLCGQLQASELSIAAKIIDKTVGSFFPEKRSVKTWGTTGYHAGIISHSTHMESVSAPQDADFLLLESEVPTELKGDAVLFSTSLDLFTHDDRIVGAFFWQKGRPNLIFLRSRLEQHNLTLSSDFDTFIEDEL